MSQVFISYRQTDDEQRQRVRAFGERLQGCGIDVVLDQFFLDDNAGGPNEGWPKWSSDCALQTKYVLIVGTQAWFQCFEGTQPAGTGLGAACEAYDLRQRIYDAGNVLDNVRVVLFDEAEALHIPGKLKPYHRFHAQRDFQNMVRWLGGKLPRGRGGKNGKLRKANNPFQTVGALRHDHSAYVRRVFDDDFERCIYGPKLLISITGEFGIGKSSLMQQARRILVDHQFFGGGLADMCGHDASLFMKLFFKLFAKRFGPISEWDELDEYVNQCPSVLLLDDVGEVAPPGLAALVPALVARVTKHEAKLRVIATSSQPLQTVFAARGLDNPKYSKPWTHISIGTCNDAEARELLRLLPTRSQAIAMRQLGVVEAISQFAPQRLQCLCYRLYDGECDGLSDTELSTLISNSASYK